MRIAVAAALALALLVAWPSASYANQDGYAVPADSNGVDLTALATGVQPADTDGSPAQPPPSCGLVAVPAVWSDVASTGGFSEFPAGVVTYVRPGTAGTWYANTCISNDSLIFIPAGSNVDPKVLADSARNHLGLQPVPFQMAPAANDWQYVGSETWFWVDRDYWVPKTAVATAGPVTVTVTATPSKLRFEIETGARPDTSEPRMDTLTCPDGGVAFDTSRGDAEQSTNCGYVWRHSSAATTDERLGVTSRIGYHVTWSVTGAAGGGDFGTLWSAPQSVRLFVGEIQSVSSS
jgi:hypothetical protein